MSWEELLAAYLEHLAGQGRAPATVRRAAVDLRAFAAWCRGRGARWAAQVSRGTVRDYGRELGWRWLRGELSHATTRARASRALALLRWAAAAGHLVVDPCRHLELRHPDPTLRDRIRSLDPQP